MQTLEPIDQLINKIKLEFEASEKPGQIIAEHLKTYLNEGHDDWKKYALFCKHAYCRNLVHIDDNFELIVLCWEEGQESPVHNHSVCNPFFLIIWQESIVIFNSQLYMI